MIFYQTCTLEQYRNVCKRKFLSVVHDCFDTERNPAQLPGGANMYRQDTLYKGHG